MVEYLVEKGAKVNEKNADGDTALHILASAGLSGCSSALLKRGSDVRAKNKAGKPPAMLAREKGYEKLATMLDKKQGS